MVDMVANMKVYKVADIKVKKVANMKRLPWIKWKMEYLFWKNIDIAKGEPSKIQFHVYLIKVVISRTCLEPLVLFN